LFDQLQQGSEAASTGPAARMLAGKADQLRPLHLLLLLLDTMEALRSLKVERETATTIAHNRFRELQHGSS
jgi:hypothetical protein